MAALGSYGGYADTCDLTCQTYRGIANESPLTDAATVDTAATVMEEGGRIMTTEYSASTGGYTAPGTFPAVVDDGDSICPPGVNGACNPNHTWQVSVPVSTIEAAWPQLGTLESLSITARNGFGDWGGRVTSMTLVGSSQVVVVSGDQFAAACNLRSDWFIPDGRAAERGGGDVLDARRQGVLDRGAEGAVAPFGDAPNLGSAGGLPLAAPVVGITATPDGKGYWEVAADGGIFNYGDAGYYGSAGAIHLNRPIVGMGRTASGHGYWLVASDGGIFSYGDAVFYGSTGAMTLNKPVVGMAGTPDRAATGWWRPTAGSSPSATPPSTARWAPIRSIVRSWATFTSDGAGYWLVASDGGIFAFGDAPFYGSAGNLVLAQPIVGMAVTPGGRATGWWPLTAASSPTGTPASTAPGRPDPVPPPGLSPPSDLDSASDLGLPSDVGPAPPYFRMVTEEVESTDPYGVTRSEPAKTSVPRSRTLQVGTPTDPFERSRPMSTPRNVSEPPI